MPEKDRTAYPSAVGSGRLIIAIFVGLAGAVWFLQGIGVLPGSMMSGSSFWAVVGLVLLIGAVAMIVIGLRRRRSATDGPTDCPSSG